MNLVAKEFCAAQVEDTGVVVIGAFTGAAAELQPCALVVNPNALATVAAAIHRACVMPVEEKRSRMHLLREVIRANNVQVWAESFLNAALAVQPSVKEAQQSRRDSYGEDTDLTLIASSGAPDQRIA